MTELKYEPGMLVTHPRCPEWGPGKVVYVDGARVHVVFRDVSEREAKVIGVDHVSLEKADVQTDPVLDNLPPLRQEGGKWVLTRQRLALNDALAFFTWKFPGGFTDANYIGDRQDGERHYKWKAHESFVSKLGNGQAKALLFVGKIGELRQRAFSVVGQVNLLAVFEHAAFRDALNDAAAAERFFDTLFHLLDTCEVTRDAFDPYADAVRDLPQKGNSRVASWPVATILPYLAQPGRHMFLKPQATLEAAERLGFDLRYDPAPNWPTYEALLRMSNVYLEMLRPHGARDFIDVQSFFWLVREYREPR